MLGKPQLGSSKLSHQFCVSLTLSVVFSDITAATLILL